MPSEIIERMKSVATIEQIDAEVEILSTQQREIEKEKAALLDLRKVLVIARDGKPAKTWSRKRGAIRLTDITESELPPLPTISAKADPPTKSTPSAVESHEWDNQDIALRERVRAYLKYFGEATVAETSRALRVP